MLKKPCKHLTGKDFVPRTLAEPARAGQANLSLG